MAEPVVFPQQARVQDELEKIRGEGDLALIKVQAERHKIAEADKHLQALRHELRETKKIVVRTQAPPPMTPCDPLFTIKGDEWHSVPPERRIQMEERLKAAISERTVELQKLRVSIDEVRRQRLDTMASEKAVVEERQRIEEDMQRAHKEADALKETTAALRSEIAQLEQEFDVEKHAFRVEKQRLLTEVSCASRTERSGFAEPQQLKHKASVYYNIGKRKSRLSKARQMSLEQKIVSFEQKKAALERIVEETSVYNIGEFIQRHIDQERAKTEMFERIEAKSAANSAVRDSIAQLAEDITRLSGMGDIRSIVHLEQPSELQRAITADEKQIKQLNEDTRVFVEALKMLRGPIRELHHELFPNLGDDSLFDISDLDYKSLRQLGETEDRVMQLVLNKILRETETQPASETLARLRQYQGRQHSPDEASSPASSATAPKRPPHLLRISPPSVQSKVAFIADDDDGDDAVESAMGRLVVHPGAYRRKIITEAPSRVLSDANGGNASLAAPQPLVPPPRRNAASALL